MFFPHLSNASFNMSRLPALVSETERLLKEKLRLDDSEDSNLTPAQQRYLHAAKRAAWRQARYVIRCLLLNLFSFY